MRGGDRISFAAAGSSEFDRAVLRVGLAYALFSLTLGLEIQQDPSIAQTACPAKSRRIPVRRTIHFASLGHLGLVVLGFAAESSGPSERASLIVMARMRAERLYTASLVTAEATVRALLSGSTDQVSLYTLDEVAERPR
jgi:hypothetical protein